MMPGKFLILVLFRSIAAFRIYENFFNASKNSCSHFNFFLVFFFGQFFKKNGEVDIFCCSFYFFIIFVEIFSRFCFEFVKIRQNFAGFRNFRILRVVYFKQWLWLWKGKK